MRSLTCPISCGPAVAVAKLPAASGYTKFTKGAEVTKRSEIDAFFRAEFLV